MDYKSFEKFQEYSDEFLNYFELVKANSYKNIEYVMNINVILGHQAFVSKVLDETSKIKLSPKEIFEIDIIFNCLLSNNVCYNLAKDITSNPKINKREIVKEYVQRETDDKAETSIFEMKPRGRVFVLNKNKLSQDQHKKNYLLKDITKEIIAKEGNLKIDYHLDDKKSVANYLSKNRQMIEVNKWSDLPEEIFFNENKEQNNISLLCMSIELTELKELYTKYLPTIKKIFRYEAFRSALFVDSSSSKKHICLYKDAKLKYAGKEVDLFDWSVTDNLEQLALEESQSSRLGFNSYKEDLLKQLDLSEIEFLLLLVQKESISTAIDNFCKSNEEKIKRTVESLLGSVQKLYNIDNYLEYRMKTNPSGRRDNFLLYQLINKNHDFKEIAIELMDKILEIIPDFILDVKEKDRKSILDFINNIDEIRFASYKKKFISYLSKVNDENVKVKINHIEDDITIINFNDSAIFNYTLNGLTIERNSAFILNNSLVNVIEDIKVSRRLNRIIVNLYFNKILDADLKERYVEKFIHLYKEEKKEMVNDDKNRIQSEFIAMERQFNLEKSLFNTDKENIKIKKKI